jgi:SAM-dependent methyltransferase
MRHLDIGSGINPKNPYNAAEVYGIDIQPNLNNLKNYHQVNLFSEQIPFDSNYFDSVSAFDFIEHVPRVRIKDCGDTLFPFIELMNEIYRVLKVGGQFYAVTPFYPKVEAFQDPTHVNIITKKTHEYFCGKDCYANYYGFKGNFRCIKVESISVKLGKKGKYASWIHKLYDYKRKLLGKHTHLLWELQKIDLT